MWNRALAIVLAVPAATGGLYASFLMLLTNPWVQSHVVYLHAFQMTGSKDLNVPEMFGFLRGQVNPFKIRSTSGSLLHSWHVLPIGLYQQHESELLKEPLGIVDNIESSLAFKLLQKDPGAHLIIHFHGAGGNVGSGYRVPNYKALSAADPDKTHVLTFDYRGFGLSTGSPSEQGLIEDAVAVVKWAIETAGIPPQRILIFGQSLGTAVNMAVADHFASLPEPLFFAGHILVAPFYDAPTLAATYKIAGIIPLLSPVARFPGAMDMLKSYMRDEWSTHQRIERYVSAAEDQNARYRITIIHAEDDYDIPWHHSPLLIERAVNASRTTSMTSEQIAEHRRLNGQDMGPAGTLCTWKTTNGVITERILRYGLHDVIMGNPVITIAVMNIFGSS